MSKTATGELNLLDRIKATQPQMLEERDPIGASGWAQVPNRDVYARYVIDYDWRLPFTREFIEGVEQNRLPRDGFYHETRDNERLPCQPFEIHLVGSSIRSDRLDDREGFEIRPGELVHYRSAEVWGYYCKRDADGKPVLGDEKDKDGNPLPILDIVDEKGNKREYSLLASYQLRRGARGNSDQDSIVILAGWMNQRLGVAITELEKDGDDYKGGNPDWPAHPEGFEDLIKKPFLFAKEINSPVLDRLLTPSEWQTTNNSASARAKREAGTDNTNLIGSQIAERARNMQDPTEVARKTAGDQVPVSTE